jgi:hypothetical protein
MRTLLLLSCIAALGAVGCGKKADCGEFAKTWCARVSACGGTPSAQCESIMTNLCVQSTPAACTQQTVEVDECVSAANNESCNDVLAPRPPSCQLTCKK